MRAKPRPMETVPVSPPECLSASENSPNPYLPTHTLRSPPWHESAVREAPRHARGDCVGVDDRQVTGARVKRCEVCVSLERVMRSRGYGFVSHGVVPFFRCGGYRARSRLCPRRRLRAEDALEVFAVL